MRGMEGAVSVNRKAVTQGLSTLLEHYFDKNNIKWASEVEINYPFTSDQIRVDYMTYSYPLYGSGSMVAAEQGIVGVYEVKSCMADYKSGHGLGFVGDVNTLVCPSSLAEQLRGDLFRLHVLCPIKKGRSVQAEMREQLPYAGEVEGWSLRKYYSSPAEQPYRRIPVAYALAQMLYASFAHGDSRRRHD